MPREKHRRNRDICGRGHRAWTGCPTRVVHDVRRCWPPPRLLRSALSEATVRSARRASTILAAALTAAAACKKTEPAAPAVAPAAALAPDAPKAFGPRCVWFAFRGVAPAAVVNALGLHDVAPSPWLEG